MLKFDIGDILHCHTTLVTDSDDICFIKGRKYKITDTLGDLIFFINECKYEHKFCIENWSPDYYGQWFSYREEQLKKLLDD